MERIIKGRDKEYAFPTQISVEYAICRQVIKQKMNLPNGVIVKVQGEMNDQHNHHIGGSGGLGQDCSRTVYRTIYTVNVNEELLRIAFCEWHDAKYTPEETLKYIGRYEIGYPSPNMGIRIFNKIFSSGADLNMYAPIKKEIYDNLDMYMSSNKIEDISEAIDNLISENRLPCILSGRGRR